MKHGKMEIAVRKKKKKFKASHIAHTEKGRKTRTKAKDQGQKRAQERDSVKHSKKEAIHNTNQPKMNKRKYWSATRIHQQQTLKGLSNSR